MSLVPPKNQLDVQLQPPSGDPKSVVEGRELATLIRIELARINEGETLEAVMQQLRGRSWSA